LHSVPTEAKTVYVPDAPSRQLATPLLVTETAVVGTLSEQAPQIHGFIGVTGEGGVLYWPVATNCTWPPG